MIDFGSSPRMPIDPSTTITIGAIVGELPTGAQAGLGARLLAGSYYGQTVQIWAALLAAALIAAIMVAGIGKIDRMLARRMGATG